MKTKLKLVAEKDIPILFEHLKEFVSTPNASTTGNKLPKFIDSKKFVLKYLNDNENHEYDKWYLVLNDKNIIIGNVILSKKNMISYHILKKYQRNKHGEEAIQILMEKNPRQKYFATVNKKNIKSKKFIKKFHFEEKGIIFELNKNSKKL